VHVLGALTAVSRKQGRAADLPPPSVFEPHAPHPGEEPTTNALARLDPAPALAVVEASDQVLAF